MSAELGMTAPACRLCGGPVVLERNPARAVACNLAGEWVHCDCRAAQPVAVLLPAEQQAVVDARPAFREHGQVVADRLRQLGLFDEGVA